MNNLPYEIHITVGTHSTNIPSFIDACGEIGVKPIVLELQLTSDTMQDVMTSSKFSGDDDSVLVEVQRIVSGLSDAGFDVVRKKVETVPWHPAAPSATTETPRDRYFEAHLAITIQPDCIPSLRDVVAGYAHLSRNAFKRSENGTCVVMATVRDYCMGAAAFASHVESVSNMLQSNGFVVDTPIIEYALYDSNTDHDILWVNA